MSVESHFITTIPVAKTNFLDLMKKITNAGNTCENETGIDDARYMFLQDSLSLCLWLMISFDTFLEMCKTKAKRIDEYLIVDSETHSRYLLTHDMYNRISYATIQMFRAEDFIKNLMKGLQKPPKGNYFNFTKVLLKHLKINEPQKHLILNAPYQLRNSLHNNGYAYHDFKVTLQNNDYIFEKGKQVKFLGWNHLFIFFDEFFELIIEIINNPTVKEITKIPHTYELTMKSQS